MLPGIGRHNPTERAPFSLCAPSFRRLRISAVAKRTSSSLGSTATANQDHHRRASAAPVAVAVIGCYRRRRLRRWRTPRHHGRHQRSSPRAYGRRVGGAARVRHMVDAGRVARALRGRGSDGRYRRRCPRTRRRLGLDANRGLRRMVTAKPAPHAPRFAGQIAVVTGGASGIGHATVRRLHSEGARVVIAGRNQRTLDAACRSLGPTALGVPCDVTKPDDLERLYGAVEHACGGVDVLFVNAGIKRFHAFAEIDESAVREVFDINTAGAYFTIQRALPLMQKGSAVVGSSASWCVSAPAPSPTARRARRPWSGLACGTAPRSRTCGAASPATGLYKRSRSESPTARFGSWDFSRCPPCGLEEFSVAGG
jgi:hypothetical protein